MMLTADNRLGLSVMRWTLFLSFLFPSPFSFLRIYTYMDCLLQSSSM